MSYIRCLAFGSLAIGTFLGACSSNQPTDQAPTVTVQAVTAQPDPIQEVVSADAVLYPIDQAAIVPQVSAPIKKFYVQRGSQVHTGETLAELESQPLQGAVTENQGGYEQAQAAWQTALQNAQQQLTLAKQQFDAAQNVYNSRQSLLKQGAVSQKDVEDARIALTQAQNQYNSAQKQYDLKAAEGQLNAAKGRVTSAQAQLDYARIASPIDGVVTDRPYFPGETVPSGQPILTVMNLSSIVARAHIAQDQASRLKTGDSATISSTDVNKPLQGKVTLVSPALDPASTTVEVWVQAPNPGDKLKPGANVRVNIVAQTVQNAIVIPAAALLTETNGSTSVMVIGADNKPKQQDVKVGIRNGDNVQITDGLKLGDQVATTGAYELSTEDPDVLAKTTVQIAKPAAGGDDSK
ncbi:MAG TPA: efflux RND transporter periplasmic adaptor subunit [Candidatus Acidoferrales bacterium]|nr:efflux RND transporter periplasmic adaptor subunit [Candidatus Acidoferrales bacterium]